MDPKLQQALKRAAEDAIQVQNACNLSGVVHSFSKILKDVLWPAAHEQGLGTDWVNTHPISVLFAEKIVDLTGVRPYSSDTYINILAAVQECRQIIAEAEDANIHV